METKYESNEGGDNTNYGVAATSAIYGGQTFTPSVTHIITKVVLKLWRDNGLVGTVTVSIKATSAGLPTGADLCSGTTNGNTLPTSSGAATWRDITQGTGAVLASGVQYAIVVTASTVTNPPVLEQRMFSPGSNYAGGTLVRTSDTGSSWITVNGDGMFEEWGEPGTSAAAVTTQAVTSISTATATGNGNVTSLGFPAATQHGIVWAAHPIPTISDSKTEEGAPSSTGAFTSSLTGLIPNTFYAVKAYIINSVGTFYGPQVVFTTTGSTPVVTTRQPISVAATTATGLGNISNLGGSAVTAHGVVWDTSADPDINDSKTDLGATSTLGDFEAGITSLTVNTLYHVRAFATNTSGTSYGADLTFTTLAAGAPIVTTQLSTDVQPTTATGNGNIVDIGGSAVTEHGHCWSTTVNPTTSDSKTTNGAGVVGSFTSQITNLTAGTAFYIRPYATNTQGTSYGDNDLINQDTVVVPPGTAPGVTPGRYSVLDEKWVYIDAAGKQRWLKGQEF